MRTLWRGLVRIVFWSFERGTWPYDLAVALIVAFVLISPRSWFEDSPNSGANGSTQMAAASPAVELRGADPGDGSQMYRVDARLVSPAAASSDSSELQQQLHEAVRQKAKYLAYGTDFEIVRVVPVTRPNGEIAYYDVIVQPQE